MHPAWRRARKKTGLARFERLSRRKIFLGGYWVFAWRVPGTPEYGQYDSLWRQTRELALAEPTLAEERRAEALGTGLNLNWMEEQP